MSKRFDQALAECIAAAEASADVQAVLRRYPEHAAELRRHLQVLGSVSQAPETPVSGFQPGLARLSAAISEKQSTGGSFMDSFLRGGLALKMTGAVVIVAAVAFAAGYFTGDSGADEAAALDPAGCLDSVLGVLDGEEGFTFADIDAFRTAFEEQDTSPQFDRDTDGDVDLDDVMVYIQELKDCFSSSFGPPSGG